MSLIAKAPPRPIVLVVDDDPENIAVLSEALRSWCQVRVATSGLKALTIIGSDEPPDLILLDVMMPGISGLDVCRKLQGSRARRDIPIIFVSALGDAEDECRGLALGAVDYIKKPTNPSIVRARVRLHLDLKHTRDALMRRNAALEEQVSEQITRQFERAVQPPARVYRIDGGPPLAEEPAPSAAPARRL